jgi:nuclear transport factor 2 (NTF2) superfamily protein
LPKQLNHLDNPKGERGCAPPKIHAKLFMTQNLKPPFNTESARAKVQMAEDLWNTKNPEKVALAYTEDTVWRNRDEFLNGRAEIIAFLGHKWRKELGYRLKKELFLFSDDKIAVQFQYEWHDLSGQKFHSYGLEHWEFAPDGRMKKRTASINDVALGKI